LISLVIQLGAIYIFLSEKKSGISKKEFLPISVFPYSEEKSNQTDPKPQEQLREISGLDSIEESKGAQPHQEGWGESDYLPLAGVDEAARPTQSLMPQYPEAARIANIEGTVVLEVYIDEKGMVRKMNVVKGIGFGCEEATMERVKSTDFIPAKMGGSPVSFKHTYYFEFRLR